MREHGFTLLEVLVAFTLLVLLFGALFEVFSGGLTVTRSGEIHSRAALLAESKLAEISADESLGPGTHTGVFDVNAVEGPRYRWRAHLDRYVEDALGPADRGEVVPYRTVVEILWNADGREGRFVLTSLVLRSKR